MAALPGMVGTLCGLQHLDLSGCCNPNALPEQLGQLGGSLMHLNLANCISLESLPESIDQLVALRRLNLTNCRFPGSLLESLRWLPRLVDRVGWEEH